MPSSIDAAAASRSVPRAQSGGSAPLVQAAACGILGVAILLWFEPFDLLQHVPGRFSSVLLPAAGLAVLVATPARKLAAIPVSLSLVAFTVWAIVTRVWSVSPFNTELEIRVALLPILIVIAVAATIPPLVAARTLVVTMIGIVLWSLGTSLALPISRAVTLNDLGDRQIGFRGGFGHKNQLGIFAVYALCLFIPFVRSRFRSLLIGLTIATILATRSATAGSGLFLVVYVWMWTSAIASQRTKHERSMLMILSLVSAVAAVLSALGLLPTLLGLYDKDVTFSGRTVIGAESLKVVGERPLLGYGFRGVFTPTRPPVMVDLQRDIGAAAAHTHNGVIELLLEVGVIGVGLFALFVASLVGYVGRTLRRPGTTRFGQWGLLSLCALFLMSMSEPLFEGPHLGLLGIVWVVLVRAHHEDKALTSSPPVSP
ncbi:hypothetical protein BH24ACT5_BH24ACT5_00070 [soil metagenome]